MNNLLQILSPEVELATKNENDMYVHITCCRSSRQRSSWPLKMKMICMYTNVFIRLSTRLVGATTQLVLVGLELLPALLEGRRQGRALPREELGRQRDGLGVELTSLLRSGRRSEGGNGRGTSSGSGCDGRGRWYGDAASLLLLKNDLPLHVVELFAGLGGFQQTLRERLGDGELVARVGTGMCGT